MAKPEHPSPKPAPAPAPPRCALCGEPCHVAPIVGRPGWEVQQCECSDRLRRRASVAAERLDAR